MNLSAKTEYACLAMLELAQHHASGEPVQVRRIAERNGIPGQFLVQIFQQLKRAGFVLSVRGAGGGYQLARDPAEISLAEVFDEFQTTGDFTTCAANDSPLAPVLTDVCQELSAILRARLEGITLADLLERAAAQLDPMWYI
jgi:Rrf2 family protein